MGYQDDKDDDNGCCWYSLANGKTPGPAILASAHSRPISGEMGERTLSSTDTHEEEATQEPSNTSDEWEGPPCEKKLW